MRDRSTAVVLIAAAALCTSAASALLHPSRGQAQPQNDAQLQDDVQPEDVQPDDDISPAEQRTAAAEAYDRGTAAFLAEEYEKAARWFETAHRMAPAPAALIQAIRSHERAGNHARAGTLALRLQDEYAGEKNAVEHAEKVLENVQDDYFRLDVECSGCEVELDGKLQAGRAFLLEPATPHRIIAHFETGDVRKEVRGEAGQSRTLELEAPPPSEEPAVALGPEGAAEAESEEHELFLDGPLPPLVTYVAGGVTLALAGVLTWSSIDTLAGVDTYDDAAAECMVRDTPECDRARTLLEEGEDKELRTNILIGATAAAAVGTAVTALFFTDWSGKQEHADPGPSVRGAVVPIVSGGARAVVEGRF